MNISITTKKYDLIFLLLLQLQGELNTVGQHIIQVVNSIFKLICLTSYINNVFKSYAVSVQDMISTFSCYFTKLQDPNHCAPHPPEKYFKRRKQQFNVITLNIFHAISLTWNESEYIWTRFQNNKNIFFNIVTLCLEK